VHPVRHDEIEALVERHVERHAGEIHRLEGLWITL
jgi:hypothetical protein